MSYLTVLNRQSYTTIYRECCIGVSMRWMRYECNCHYYLHSVEITSYKSDFVQRLGMRKPADEYPLAGVENVLGSLVT